MCEILLCVHNLGKSGKLHLDSKAPQIGDVVCVHDDGENWGRCELGETVEGNPHKNHPFWRVIKLPNVSKSLAETLLSEEISSDSQNHSPYLQYRGFFLDRSKIKDQSLIDHLYDDSRKTPYIVSLISNDEFKQLISQRTPIPFG